MTKFLTKEEFEEILETHAKRSVGVGFDEFVGRWKAGEYRGIDDPRQGAGFAGLVMLAGDRLK